MFKESQLPEDIAVVSVDLTPNDEGLIYLPGALKEAGLAPSAGEARRLIDGGGVKVNGEALAPQSLQCGSRGSRRRRGAGGEEEVRALRVAFEAGVSVLRFAG